MLRYATSNEGKAREATKFLGEGVESVDVEYVEVQANDIRDIAAAGATAAFDKLGGEDPVIVDDAGLFIEALGGFPGPYSSYVEDTLGIERVANLAMGESETAASFRAVIGFTDGTIVETFEGRCRGKIVPPRGDGGFGYDPIFAHGDRTFAEMNVEEKNAISHRGRALERFTEWYADRTNTAGARRP